ncbi:hypothetical protein LguiB_001155 [Lonicera macranthoides]
MDHHNIDGNQTVIRLFMEDLKIDPLILVQNEGYYLQVAAKDAMLNSLLVAVKDIICSWHQFYERAQGLENSDGLFALVIFEYFVQLGHKD